MSTQPYLLRVVLAAITIIGIVVSAWFIWQIRSILLLLGIGILFAAVIEPLVNRLRRGMRLQTDPAVIYGMGTRFDGNLRKRDLEEDTPYNTYVRDGLPPTPIALPSQAALDAAVNPPKTTYLYFVSRGDGTSEFSASLPEHNRAVAKYQKGGR